MESPPPATARRASRAVGGQKPRRTRRTRSQPRRNPEPQRKTENRRFSQTGVAIRGPRRFTFMRENLSNVCRYSGCRRPRTAMSVFCEQHHLQQLDRADTVALPPLPPKTVLSLIVGPTWLNLLRIAAAAVISLIFELASAFIAASMFALISAGIGWRKSHRLVWN